MQPIVLPLDQLVAPLPPPLLTFQREEAPAKARLESLRVMKIVFLFRHEGPGGDPAEPPSVSPAAANLPTAPQVGVHLLRPIRPPLIRAGGPHPLRTQLWLLPGVHQAVPQTQCLLRQVSRDNHFGPS